MSSSRAMTAIMVGAGQRGTEAYGPYALRHPDQLRFVAVAEPHETRRTRFALAHGIPPQRQYRSWEDLLQSEQIADAALVCTLDDQHVRPAVAAMEAGYHVLLEKPMASTFEDCLHLVRSSERTGRILMVCHVLRYTSFFSQLHRIIGSGRLGDVITVEHRENVAYWHMAHSFVRGNWRRSQNPSPMILAKCCHDLDILSWNLGPVRRLSSFGSLSHYRPENAPQGAPSRCTDGCPQQNGCPWYAPRLYLEMIPLLQLAGHSPIASERWGSRLVLRVPGLVGAARRWVPWLDRAIDYHDWPISAISEDTTPEGRLAALRTGPYGRCVYHCDNDVVDHQTVNLEFESGVTATLCMHGHSHQEGRTMRYDGSRATLEGRFGPAGSYVDVHDHLTGKTESLATAQNLRGHGGGDEGIMAAFVRAVRHGPSASMTNARAALESHVLAFAAERSRLRGGSVQEIAAYRSLVDV